MKKILRNVILKTLWTLLFMVVVAGCHRPERVPAGDIFPRQRFAQWFSMKKLPDVTLVTVINPFDSATPAARMVLYPRQKKAPDGYPGYTPVPVPLRRIACTSSTAITFADKCGHVGAVVSVSDAAFVFNPVVREKLSSGAVTEVAQGTAIWYEKLSLSAPEAIFVSMFDGQELNRIRDLGIVVIPFADYLENTPLGRAEWIKFMGAFFGETEKSDMLFDTIAARYGRITALASTATEKPVIFDGLPIEGSWYVSGGESYMAAMYRDAGASYLWAGEPGTASIVMAYEKVFAQASGAPFWRMVVNMPGSFTRERLLALDERYGLFQAVRSGGVIWSNAAHCPLFEQGVAEPDVVLSDLVSHLHPHLLPGYVPRYYLNL